MVVDVGFSGGSAAPWSSVNNCTRDPAAGADGVEHADHKVNATVNFDALSRKEKRELAQRLIEDSRRTRKKHTPNPIEGARLSAKEQHVRELMDLRGIDASAGMVKSIMAGASVACGDLVMTLQDGRLISRNRSASGLDKLPSQVMVVKQKTSDLVNRMKAAGSRQK